MLGETGSYIAIRVSRYSIYVGIWDQKSNYVRLIGSSEKKIIQNSARLLDVGDIGV